MLRLSAFCSRVGALIDVLYLIAPVCSVYFRGLVYLCLICSGSKIDKLDVTLRSIGHHTLNKVCVIQPAADLVSTLRCGCKSWHTSAGDQKTDAKSNPSPDNCVKIRSPGRNTLSQTLYGSLDSYFSHFITPDVHFSYMLRQAQLSVACCLRECTISRSVSRKKSARKGKSNYSDLLLFVVTVTRGFAFLQIFKQNLIYFPAKAFCYSRVATVACRRAWMVFGHEFPV